MVLWVSVVGDNRLPSGDNSAYLPAIPLKKQYYDDEAISQIYHLNLSVKQFQASKNTNPPFISPYLRGRWYYVMSIYE